MAPGEYCVTVNDGCETVSKCFEILDCNLQNLSVSGNVEHTCSNVSFGSIALNISGGKPPYQILWNTGSSSQTITNLSVGQYCATVVDGNGCLTNGCFTVNNSTEITQTRDGCVISFFCNGNFLTSEDLGSFFTVDFATCTRNYFCNDGVPLGPEPGLITYGPADSDCLRNTFCEGQFVGVTFGETHIEENLSTCTNLLVCTENGQVLANQSAVNECQILEADGNCTHVSFCELNNSVNGWIYCTRCQIQGCNNAVISQVPLPPSCGRGRQMERYDNPGMKFYVPEAYHDEIRKIFEEHLRDLEKREVQTVPKERRTVESPPDLISNGLFEEVYPNPFAKAIHINLKATEDETVSVSIVNMLGQSVFTESFSLAKGQNILKVDNLDDIALGVYYLQIKDSIGNESIHKIIHSKN